MQPILVYGPYVTIAHFRAAPSRGHAREAPSSLAVSVTAGGVGDSDGNCATVDGATFLAIAAAAATVARAEGLPETHNSEGRPLALT